MKLALSVRVAETPAKDRLTVSFRNFAVIAKRHGYHAVCLRPSVLNTATPANERQAIVEVLRELNLAVSMATTDIAVPLNNEHGPDSLRDIEPHLQIVEQVTTDLIRICMKQSDDMPWAQRAADVALKRGIRLVHQCHTDSLFETIADAKRVIAQVDRPNFGIIYEPANLMLCGEPYDHRAVLPLQSRIWNVYVQNHRESTKGKLHMPTRVRGEVYFDPLPIWDSGGVDFTAVFDALKAIRYDGFITVHQAYAELMGAEEAAAKSAEFLRSLATFDPPTP